MSRAYKTSRKSVSKPKSSPFFTSRERQKIQIKNKDLEKEMGEIFEDYLITPPQTQSSLSISSEKSLSISSQKCISILIIGHGSVIGNKKLVFASRPLCLTKYIVPFGNIAFLSNNIDRNGLNALGDETTFTYTTKEEFKQHMDDFTGGIIDTIYEQKRRTIKHNQPISYERVKTVYSTLQLNKSYDFFDNNEDEYYTKQNNTYGVYILQNNMGIPNKTKILDRIDPTTTYESIINTLMDIYGLDDTSLIYTIDTTCNAVLYDDEKESKQAPRMIRASARELDNIIDGINKGSINKNNLHIYVDTEFFDRILGGKKTRKNRRKT